MYITRWRCVSDLFTEGPRGINHFYTDHELYDWLLLRYIPCGYMYIYACLYGTAVLPLSYSLFADFATIFAYGIVFYFDMEHFHLIK